MIEVERERRRWNMGVYLNPGNEKFAKAVQSEIYVDKTGLIEYTDQVINTVQRYVCVSRPRRFGKSMTADMLTAYYGKECDSRELFSGLKISQNAVFVQHLNQYPTIFLNMQEFLSRSKEIGQVIDRVRRMLLRELKNSYPDVDYFDDTDLVESMQDIYAATKQSFVIIIDEWDCVFREYQQDKKAQEEYLDFLRDFLKDKVYVALAYLTGILPIKKYGTHSALNMFDEFTMLDPGPLAEYVGFTEQEVQELCPQYDMSYDKMKQWYDGYDLKGIQIYNPRSVVMSLSGHDFDSYWTKTETYEALKKYIQMDMYNLKELVTRLIAGSSIEINPDKFQNDMTTFASADDVLTLLVHLGYLTYDSDAEKVSIPNREVAQEYVNAVSTMDWHEVARSIEASRKLLEALWKMDEAAVAKGVEQAHKEISVLQYNNENALSCTINLAFYFAREYYTIIRELPTGKGFADICMIPRKIHADKPAVIIELKWDKSASGAIAQIKEKKYIDALSEYQGNLLLAGINYDKKIKKGVDISDSIMLEYTLSRGRTRQFNL